MEGTADTGSSCSAIAAEATATAASERLLRLHRRDLPQKDDLCGPFCVSLALRAAGVERADQDAVAVAAGGLISERPDPESLPPGETGRRDYRLELPRTRSGALSGTTPAGLVHAVTELSGGRLEAVPLVGAWSAAGVLAVLDAIGQLAGPATLIANLTTGRLWGARPGVEQLARYLLRGDLDGPPADWRVGHYVCLVGVIRGPQGTLVAVADTYGSLGFDGIHLQPVECVAAALLRGDGVDGGLLAVVAADEAEAICGKAVEAGLGSSVWENGTKQR
jgi:hypothetical protein